MPSSWNSHKAVTFGFHPEKRLDGVDIPAALILRAAEGGVSKDQGVSSQLWTLLRDGHFVTSSG
jgi:hypothetical protein